MNGIAAKYCEGAPEVFGLNFLYSEAGGTEQQQHLDFVQNESSVSNQKQN